MKKFFLLALAVFGLNASVMAEETIEATLDHTASAQWGSNKGSGVDNPEEYYNMESRTGWSAAAFAKFDFELPEGATIIKIDLVWHGRCGSNTKGSDMNGLYVLNTGVELDFSKIVAGTYGNDNGWLFGGQKSPNMFNTGFYPGQNETFTTDVTKYVKSVAEAQNYVIFQWTNNNRGSYVSGKNSEYAPRLIFTISMAAADCSFSYVDVESGAELKKDVLSGFVYDQPAVVSDDQKLSFWSEDKKYEYVSDNASDVVVAQDGSSVVTITVKEASKYNYKVSGFIPADGENEEVSDLFEQTGELYNGENVYVAVPEHIVIDSVDYVFDGYGKPDYFHAGTRINGEDAEIKVPYHKGSFSGIVFFEEGEDLFGDANVSNQSVRCSMAKSGTPGTAEFKTICTLEPGKYSIFTLAWGSADRQFIYTVKGAKFVAKDSEGNPVLDEFEQPTYVVKDTVLINYTTGSRAPAGSAEFIVTETTNLQVIATADNIGIDYVMVYTSGQFAGVDEPEGDNDDPIEQIKADNVDSKIYNLQGQEVKMLNKGIYIQNGKKYIVK